MRHSYGVKQSKYENSNMVKIREELKRKKNKTRILSINIYIYLKELPYER